MQIDFEVMTQECTRHNAFSSRGFGSIERQVPFDVARMRLKQEVHACEHTCLSAKVKRLDCQSPRNFSISEIKIKLTKRLCETSVSAVYFRNVTS